MAVYTINYLVADEHGMTRAMRQAVCPAHPLEGAGVPASAASPENHSSPTKPRLVWWKDEEGKWHGPSEVAVWGEAMFPSLQTQDRSGSLSRTPERRPRRRRRRGPRRPRVNRTTRAQRKAKMSPLLLLLQLLSVAQSAPLKTFNASDGEPVGAAWALAPGLPSVSLATWPGQPVPLQVASNASLLLGGAPLRPIKAHLHNQSVTLPSWNIPICLTKNSTVNPLCAPVVNGSIKETPHGPHGHLGHGDWLHLFMIQHNISSAHVHLNMLNSTGMLWASASSPSPLSPCVASPNMFSGIQICSAGWNVTGPDLNGTRLWFMDGAPGPWLAAPVPHLSYHGQTRVQTHLWKAAAAFGPLIHMTDNSAPLTDNATLNTAWWTLLTSRGYSCHEPSGNGHCNTFSVTVQTISDTDMFWVCHSGSLTNEGGRYQVNCSDGLFTNTVNETALGNASMLLLLQVPPVTFLPVAHALPFASTVFEEVLTRQAREVSAVDVINLALSFVLQVEVGALQSKVQLVVEDLEGYMRKNNAAWQTQSHLNSLLVQKLEEPSVVVAQIALTQEVQIRMSRLSCDLRFKHLCLTPLPFNGSTEIEQLLKNISDWRDVDRYLQQLDTVIDGLNNLLNYKGTG